MKTKYIGLLTILIPAILIIVGCEEEDKRKVYPHSTPAVESATITPSTFNYGDTVAFTAKVSDPLTPLSTIEVKMTVNEMIISQQVARTKGQSTDVNIELPVKYTHMLPDNSEVDVEVTLINVEGDKTVHKVQSITGKRKYYEKLYLVLDNGEVTDLTPLADNPDRYAADVDLANKVRYKIAESLYEDKQIDYTDDVWGFKDDEIQVVDQTGDYITTSEPMKKSTERFIFDAYEFRTILEGDDLVKAEKFEMNQFTERITQGTETYLEASFYVEKDQEIELGTDFADVVFNLDYFDRVSVDKVKYLGETGPIVLDYNPDRKYMLVQEIDASYPIAMVICGEGLGYPSKVKPEATTGWGFGNIHEFILFKKIGDNIYQGTVYVDAGKLNFKPFETKDWGNEKKSDDYKLPPLLIDSETKSEGADINGNWFAAPDAVSGYYRIIINLNTSEVTATEVVIP